MSHATPHHPPKKHLPLVVSALGVVFGDIGTSPLYTLRECFHAANIIPTPENVLGILSLIAWSLILVVTGKYVSVVLRADNRGEGGILALTTLASDQFFHPSLRTAVLFIGLTGAALFYGDALITPAISVLSAVEGLHIATPALDAYVKPIALILIILLFGLQKHGTHVVGVLFGPVMLVWFSTLAVLGAIHIINNPFVLGALSPMHGLHFITANPGTAFITLSAVVLAITGAEALYADMGHFGRKPVQHAWLYLVFPALMLVYFGQGALLLIDGGALHNPFFMMVTPQFTLPLVILATFATIIASQSVISGAYSLTQQAIQLGYLPRMEVRHTNAHEVGQVYLPFLNWLLCSVITILVIGFGTSSNLAGAYGIAVTGTMIASTLLVTVVMHQRAKWPLYVALPFLALFLVTDLTFFTSNLHKIPAGGWFPLVLAGVVLFIMHTWLKGRHQAHQMQLKSTPMLDKFLKNLKPETYHRTPRTAVFLTSDINHVPIALIHNLTHNNVLHAQTIVLKISRARIPRYPAAERIAIKHLAHGFATVQATYGFMEQPNVPALLGQLAHHGLILKHPNELSYVLGTHTYIPSTNTALNPAQEPVFIFLDKFAQSAVTYFHIPRKQVIEIGNQIEI